MTLYNIGEKHLPDRGEVKKMQNFRLYYSNKLLKSRLKKRHYETESRNFSVIAEYVKKEASQQKSIRETFSKEQLYALGISAIEIHKYFEFVKNKDCTTNKGWKLKDNLAIDDCPINNVRDLIIYKNQTKSQKIAC